MNAQKCDTRSIIVFGFNEQYARAEINIAALAVDTYNIYYTCLVNVTYFYSLVLAKKSSEIVKINCE
jgi:hypothetical protein